MPGPRGQQQNQNQQSDTNSQGGNNFKYQQKGQQKAQGQRTGENKGQQSGVKYQPKSAQNNDASGNRIQSARVGGQQQYQQKQGGGGQGYQKNYKKGQQNQPGGQYAKGPNMQGANKQPRMQDLSQFLPHQQNLQNVDQSELKELLVNVLQIYGPELATLTSGQNGSGPGGIQAVLSGIQQKQQQQNRQFQQSQNYGGNNRQYQQKQYGGQQQNQQANLGMMLNAMGGQPPPQPVGVPDASGQDPMAHILSQMMAAQNPQGNMNPGMGGMQNVYNPGAQMFNQPGLNDLNQDASMGEEKKMSSEAADGEGKPQPVLDPAMAQSKIMQQQQALMTQNICEKHFPEPIIYMSEGKPLCRKCIPEHLENVKKNKKAEGKEDDQQIVQMLGLTGFQGLNMYTSEKNMINKCLLKIDDFKGEFRYLHDEIEERAEESKDNLENLPELMCQIFDACEKSKIEHKSQFLSEIDEIIAKQQASFKKDDETKVPNFYERLSLKYGQLQQATQNADDMSKEELITTLENYHQIFVDLDAEFEKYFNEFENVSKLQRLLEKDENEIIKDYTNLMETNLRVDYNVKNSFQPGVPSRVHSFQWNQKYAYIFKVHNQEFEKRHVQMDFEVPLYSRSIAVEDSGIYLIGGCDKRRSRYLKKCWRYNEIFANLDEKSSMIYPHADHSLCAIEGYIYVVGTFVNSQVYGFCEVYDIQKDQWKQIDSLRVARSGVALSSFKNNYIFAFGGRIDQKTIVDTIECYDISKNVWQEIAGVGSQSTGPLCDKSAWIPGYMSLSYQITDNEIIIFGGKSALTQQIFNGCFVFDVQKMEVREKGKLVNPCSFMNTPLVFGGNMYAYGNDIYIHRYNIAEQKWSCIPKAFP